MCVCVRVLDRYRFQIKTRFIDHITQLHMHRCQLEQPKKNTVFRGLPLRLPLLVLWHYICGTNLQTAGQYVVAAVSMVVMHDAEHWTRCPTTNGTHGFNHSKLNCKISLNFGTHTPRFQYSRAYATTYIYVYIYIHVVCTVQIRGSSQIDLKTQTLDIICVRWPLMVVIQHHNNDSFNSNQSGIYTYIIGVCVQLSKLKNKSSTSLTSDLVSVRRSCVVRNRYQLLLLNASVG